MRFKLSANHNLQSLITNNYYIIVMLLYFITLFIKFFPVGKIAAGVILLILVQCLLRNENISKINYVDVFVYLYLLYCSISMIAVLINGFPSGVFVQAFSNSILPAIFYFATKNNCLAFYKRTLYAILFCGGAGLVLYYFRPAWYIEYCKNYGFAYNRLSSFIGSTGVGSLSAVALLISLLILVQTKGKEGKIFYGFSLLISFLSMQRSAWFVALMTVLAFHFLFFIKWKALKLKYFLLEILAGGAGLFLVRNAIYEAVQSWLTERTVVASRGVDVGLISGRSDQWSLALKNVDWIFGQGVGTVGHKAIGYSEYLVMDGSWISSLCELGIMGMTIFSAIILFSIVIGLKHIRQLYLPLGIIVCICIQAVGSNLFEYQMIMPIFWYAIGNISYFNKRRKNENNENTRYLFAPIP